MGNINIRVNTNDADGFIHEEADRWVVDVDGRLTILSGDKQVAVYNVHCWANVGYFPARPRAVSA